jgi:D-serine deaminase-like pyridoxal phosphate-dependent protein
VTLATLSTPCLVLEKSRLERNLQRMSARARELGVAFRPHLKTAKSLEVAQLAAEGPSRPITVSTLHEAEYFHAGGFNDLLYAISISPDKLPRAAALIRKGARLTLVLDSVDAAHSVAAFAAQEQVPVRVLIELDTGEGRSGIRWYAPELLDIARAIHVPPYSILHGVMTHAGHSYTARDLATVADIAEVERNSTVRAAERLRTAGFDAPVVSIGSTPTALHARHLDGVTEVRAGVYMFGDLFQAEIGSCGLDDLAVGVLATVVGHRRDAGHALIDAGGLALSKDRSTADAPRDYGFGLLRREDGSAFAQELVVGRVYQEHGLVKAVTGQVPFDELPIGTRVRVLPNHVCMTAAMYDRYHVLADGLLQRTWHRTNGW